MTQKQKVPVSMGAIIQRINRKLAADEWVLKVTRGNRAKIDLGACYIRDWRNNNIVATNVDPEQYAREIGVLAEWEEAVS